MKKLYEKLGNIWLDKCILTIISLVDIMRLAAVYYSGMTLGLDGLERK